MPQKAEGRRQKAEGKKRKGEKAKSKGKKLKANCQLPIAVGIIKPSHHQTIKPSKTPYSFLISANFAFISSTEVLATILKNSAL
jgi:hypothetical protein